MAAFKKPAGVLSVRSHKKSVEKKAMVLASSLQLKPKFPKKVLNEEDYTEDMEKIIERDFFPDLEKLNAQTEYLNAMERNDARKMRELQIKYGPRIKRKTTPSVYNTPATFETPDPTAKVRSSPPRMHGAERRGDGEAELARERDDDFDEDEAGKSQNKNDPRRLSLDKYLARYTSEDNAAFGDLMTEAERKLANKHAWLYEAEIAHRVASTNQLALPSIDTQALTDTNSAAGSVDGWTYEAKNKVMYVPEGLALSNKEVLDGTRAKEREIAHDNTRFDSNPFDEVAKKQALEKAASAQAASQAGKVGADGKELVPTQTPNVNGYSFVATPAPQPGIDESPLMTWGEIEGTPFRLDAGDTPAGPSAPGPQFRMPEAPLRDEIALSLVEKASAQHRKKKEEAVRKASQTFATPSPRMGSAKSLGRLASMSEAAQRLASSKLGVRVGTSSRHGITPLGLDTPAARRTPGRTPSSTTAAAAGTTQGRRTPTSGIVASYRSVRSSREKGSRTSRKFDTPKQSPATTPSQQTRRRAESLTDNLLNLSAATTTSKRTKTQHPTTP